MNYLKLFEGFNSENLKNDILQSGLLDVLYDLKEVSLEFIDDLNYDGYLMFSVYVVYPEDTVQLLSGCYRRSDGNIESNLEWVCDPDKSIVTDVISSFSNNKVCSLKIDFAIVFDPNEEDEEVPVYRQMSDMYIDNPAILTDQSQKTYKKISEIYPDIEFDIYSPWDL